MKIEGTNNNIILEKLTTPTDNAVVTSKVQNAVNTITDVVSLHSKPKEENLKHSSEINNTITALNIANDATNKLEKMFGSIQGIVEQIANNQDIAPKKVQVLQKEANELLSGMKSLTNETDFEKLQPITDEQAKIYVEEKIGHTLDMIFPDDVKDAFGIDEFDFSEKDHIINTLATIKTTEVRIAILKHTIAQNYDDLQGINNAKQNYENGLENVDEAMKLSSALQGKIEVAPEEALMASTNNLSNFNQYLL